jgi:hypothetical protein
MAWLKSQSATTGSGGEIQITDAMIRLMARQPFHGLKYKGVTYDCGDKVGFLSANVAFALEHETLGDAFRLALEQTIATHGGFLRWGTSPSLSDVLEILKRGAATEAEAPTALEVSVDEVEDTLFKSA